ncbi:MAG: hypothetical protein IT452_14845 [Planctomycetia bacterium]|nr:hypothetical protein [Planctomycetia bacterium]
MTEADLFRPPAWTREEVLDRIPRCGELSVPDPIAITCAAIRGAFDLHPPGPFDFEAFGRAVVEALRAIFLGIPDVLGLVGMLPPNKLADWEEWNYFARAVQANNPFDVAENHPVEAHRKAADELLTMLALPRELVRWDDMLPAFRHAARWLMARGKAALLLDPKERRDEKHAAMETYKEAAARGGLDDPERIWWKGDAGWKWHGTNVLDKLRSKAVTRRRDVRTTSLDARAGDTDALAPKDTAHPAEEVAAINLARDAAEIVRDTIFEETIRRSNEALTAIANAIRDGRDVDEVVAERGIDRRRVWEARKIIASLALRDPRVREWLATMPEEKSEPA